MTYQEVLWVKMMTNTTNKKIGIGDLKTPVSFFAYKPNDGPDPGEVEKEKLYFCTALVYNPSMKDMAILDAKGTKNGVTIKIRDPHTSYIPDNQHKVEILDFRYQNADKVYAVWEIVDVALDFEDNRFIKLILRMTE